MNPIFSIIIPVYQVEKYLRECLDSVRKQACKNYEVILIDDGSKDNSRVICDEYVGMDTRFSVIHQENAGLAAARNKGLAVANGEYIVFLDSDDMIEKEFLTKVYTQLADEKYDVCSFAVRKIDAENNILYYIGYKQDIQSMSFNEKNRYSFIWHHFLQYKVGWEAWNYVYKRSIISNNHIFFHEDILFAEDIPFTMEYMLYTDRLVKLPDILYNYRTQETSITQTRRAEEQFQGLLTKNYNYMLESLRKKQRHCKDDIYLYVALLHYFISVYSQDIDSERMRELLLRDGKEPDVWKKITHNLKEIKSEFGQEIHDEMKLLMLAWLGGRQT